MHDERQTPYRRLRSRMFLFLSAFGLVPVLGLLATGVAAERRAADLRARSVLESMIKNRKATVDLFLEKSARELELVARATPTAALRQTSTLESLLAEMRRDGGGIVDLGLIDADGRHLAYAGPYDLAGRNYRDQPWFQQVKVRGRYQSDVFMGFRRYPHVIIAVPLRTDGHDYILRATLDTDVLGGLLREGGLESGADVFILNRAGEYQSRYSEQHHLMQKANMPPPPVHSGVRVTAQVRQGRRELVATTWLKGDSWVLVARQPAPASTVIGWQSPAVLIALAAFLVVPLGAHLAARYNLKQVRELEEDRARLHESVAQSEKLAAIGRLAATTAHEINNPLAIIAAQVGVLQDIVRDSAFLTEYPDLADRLTKIANQVERGKTVTHRLLGFARRIGPVSEPVDVVAALEETVSFVEKEAEVDRIRFARDYESTVPLVRGNLGQMQQVFLNVVNNAVDALGSDGQIDLIVRCARGGVEVVVADSGPGIPEADLERVFEPFYSTKPGESRHCGLGLAICRETMRSLGGRITAMNGPRGGAAFHMWFPLHAA